MDRKTNATFSGNNRKVSILNGNVAWKSTTKYTHTFWTVFFMWEVGLGPAHGYITISTNVGNTSWSVIRASVVFFAKLTSVFNTHKLIENVSQNTKFDIDILIQCLYIIGKRPE